MGRARIALLTLMAVSIASACTAASLADTRPAAKHASSSPALRLATKIPKPGQMNLTLFKLTVKLKPGVHPPHRLLIKPVNRRRLRRGVVVVATARLLKHSPSGRAIYVGMVAVIRSKSVHPASDRPQATEAGGSDEEEVLIGGWDGFPYIPVKRSVYEAMRAQRAQWSPEKPPQLDLTDVPRTLDPSTEGHEAFDDGHAFSWSVDKPPSSSANADGVVDDLAHSIVNESLDQIISDIELKLDGDFDKWFPEDSLSGAAPFPPAVPTTYRYLLHINVFNGNESFSGTPNGSQNRAGPAYQGTATSSWSGTWDIEIYIDPRNKTARLDIPSSGDPDFRLTGTAQISDVNGSDAASSFTCPAQSVQMSSFAPVDTGVAGGGAPFTLPGHASSYATSGMVQLATSGTNGGGYHPLTCGNSGSPGFDELSVEEGTFAGLNSNLCGPVEMQFPVSDLGAGIHFPADFSYPSPSAFDPSGGQCTAVVNSYGSDTYQNTMTGRYTVDMTYQGKSSG